jgi:hypothetical protein
MRRRLVVLVVFLALLAPPAAADPKINVLSMGDSWATQWCDAMAAVILSHGTLVEVWDRGIYGATSTMWATPGALLDVELTILDNPEIEWLVISLGGNDLLDGYLLGGYGDGIFPIVDQSIRQILDELLGYFPDLKVSLNGYDFFNFLHSPECIIEGQLYLGGDTYFQNSLLAELTYIAEAIAADYPQVTFTNLLGTLQEAGGVPFPPNFYLPSPAQFYPDADECIHPRGPGGYWAIMQRIYDNYFGPLNDDDDDDDNDNDNNNDDNNNNDNDDNNDDNNNDNNDDDNNNDDNDDNDDNNDDLDDDDDDNNDNNDDLDDDDNDDDHGGGCWR